MAAKTVRVPIHRTTPTQTVSVEVGATNGAQIGINLLLDDGTLATTAKLQALFGSTGASTGTGPDTTDALDEGGFHLYFTDPRAQDAVGGILVDTATIDFAYVSGTSITATLKDLADSGTGAALVKLTRDSKGRISGTSAATTDDLTEGVTNLWYTDARADARITAQKGVANGLAPLESDGKISVSYLPAAVLGQVSYQGTWDASAGTPPTTMPDKGWYYIVTVAGSTNLDGITDWKVGDWAIYNGTAWDKVDNTDAVVTVNGYTGAVTLAYTDVGAASAAQGAKADTALQSVVAGTNVSVDNTDPLNPVISATGGGATLPPGYIDGLALKWVSGTALTLSSGSAYIEGSAAVLQAASDIAKTGLSLSASTWYHAYFYDNAGTPDFELSTTAPAAPYNGTARSKTGDTSRRYAGSVRVDSTGNIHKIRHNWATGEVDYLVDINNADLHILNNGSSASDTTVSASTAAPVTARSVIVFAENNGTGGVAEISSADAGSPINTHILAFLRPNRSLAGQVQLTSSQTFTYFCSSGSLLGVYAVGYVFER
jgi:hypothetical protein